MNRLKPFVKKELELLCEKYPDDIIAKLSREIVILMNKLSDISSGDSQVINYGKTLAHTIHRLTGFNSINDLEDESLNWIEGHHGGFYHRNDINALKNREGVAYYSKAIKFVAEKEYNVFIGQVQEIRSSQIIKNFPFKPKTFYIDVVAIPFNKDIHAIPSETRAKDGSEVVYVIKDRSQLDEVFEYYDKDTKAAKWV